uniref:MFS transporter n=1 Tax=Kitasatospora sp. MY 5-36 TaxID=1678027 RepID=UPI00069FA53C
WVINAYTLTFGGLLLLGGRAGDILGRRRVFIFGTLLFGLASLLGGFAQDSSLLLAARALQGIGGAICSPTAFALIATNFDEGPERNRAFGVFSAVAGSGAAIGLLAGGLLTEYLNWRWVFFVNVPIAILIAIAAPRHIAESERHPGRFDLPGALTSTLGLVGLVYGFIRAASDGWSDGITLGSFAAGAILLAAFLVVESRTDQPITPMHLFANRNRTGGLVMMLCLAAVESLAEALVGFAAREVPVLFAQASVDLLRPPLDPVEAWTDFELRSADYYGVLGGIVEEAGVELAAAEGFLPEDLSDRVRAEPLDDAHCRVSLRGYQAFGARFALAQRRVIIGDEMGLGKTVQAIAVLAHLRARGSTHFLVVCPASVLINWIREVESRSTLRAFRVHGPEREAALAEWLRDGGVAVVTFDGLRRLEASEVAESAAVGMVVVDEAHFVKNRAAQRSRAVAAWAERVERVLFLTGTPMENRVEEFRTLVEYLQPALVPLVRQGSAAAGPAAFRKAVAPAYLRRNQRDVLTELPEVVHVDEWEEFSPADLAAYRSAVAAGNFPAMRRAGYADPAESAKLKRLLEIVREAADGGLKVVVFSFFRDVLAAVQTALDQRAFGPIDGSLESARRQDVVDGFSAAPGHAVLLCQIQAGGVGLNIQAASVVILCEPQVKPTLEEQAVARSRRMGQVRRVRVHRLLAADSVDQRVLDLLRAKGRLFDEYARRSEVAESTPEAVDVSEQSLAALIVEEEQLRLAAAEG